MNINKNALLKSLYNNSWISIRKSQDHNTMTNNREIECPGITPDGVGGIVAAGISWGIF